MLENKEGVIDLEKIGRKHLRRIHRNLPTPLLYEAIADNKEGQIAHLGPMVVRTGHYDERSPADKYIVLDDVSKEKVYWSEEKNGISEHQFNSLFYRLLAYMQNKDVYVQDCLAGTDPEFEIPVRIITEKAWHSLFARNMFVQIHDQQKLDQFKPKFSILHIPEFQAIPELDGTHSSAFIIFNMSQKIVLVGGTSYAGEIKQAVFTIANYLLNQEDVFAMRCSANVGANGSVAIFLGSKESGKTTLAVDPERQLVGDHAHGWSSKGLFNFESGGYAKVLNIDAQAQPKIFECTRKFGTILENVAIDPITRRIDLTDGKLTKNTRAAYPISHIPNIVTDGMCGHPNHIFLLTCDAFGVLPPIARLTPEQAVYAFLSAYTSKLVKDESGEYEPVVKFNVCFGDTALALPAFTYGKKLLEKINNHKVSCWLMNTGWSGEPSQKGDRIKIEYSRALVKAAIAGQLDNVEFELDPLFQFEIPLKCPGVPDQILNPRLAAENEGEYNFRASRLVSEFVRDYAQFEEQMPEGMRSMLSQVITFGDDNEFEEFGISM